MSKEEKQLVPTSEVNRHKVMQAVLDEIDNDIKGSHGGTCANIDYILPWVDKINHNRTMLVDARIAIGFYLYQIYKLRVSAFEDDGYCFSYYDSFMLFCERTFGYSKTKVSNLICCAMKYSEYDNGMPTDKLATEFQGYSYSQLVEMLPLEIMLPASFTVKAIREKKAELAREDFLAEKAEALSYVAGLVPSFDDCRVIVADDLCVGDVLIITNSTRVVVTEVKKSSTRVSYVTTAHPSGYPERYMGSYDILYPVYLSTRPHSDLVQTSDVTSDADLVQTSDVKFHTSNLEAVPSNLEYLSTLVSSLSVGDVFYSNKVGCLMTIRHIDNRGTFSMITSLGECANMKHHAGLWQGYYRNDDCVPLVVTANEFEPVPTSDVTSDADLVQASDVTSSDTGVISFSVNKHVYSDSDFIGLHKPALVEIILHMANDGWSLAAALGYARARLERDRARVNGLSDGSEVQHD